MTLGNTNNPETEDLEIFPSSMVDLFSSLVSPASVSKQVSPLQTIPIGVERIGLRGPDSLPSRLEARLLKNWASTLGFEPDELRTVMQDPDYDYLSSYFDFDRTIRTLGGTLRISFDPHNKFGSVVLTSPDLRPHTEVIAARIFPAEILEALSQAPIIDALGLDPDRLSKKIADISPERKDQEILRAIRDEVLPTLVSGILGELGVPQRRGSRGFDLLCEPYTLSSQLTSTDDVQVKQLREDSPIFKRDNLHGRRQFWKLVAILGGESQPTTSNKLLLIQDTASNSQVAGLIDDLIAAGARHEQIIVLDKERLQLSGINLLEVPSRDPETDHPGVIIQVDLQRFLCFQWAEQFANLGDDIFRKVDPIKIAALLNEREYVLSPMRHSLDEPIEIALLRASGCLEIIEYCRINRKSA